MGGEDEVRVHVGLEQRTQTLQHLTNLILWGVGRKEITTQRMDVCPQKLLCKYKLSGSVYKIQRLT